MQPRLSLIHTLGAIKTPIVILNGLPGSGKSVVLKQLAQYLNRDIRTSLPEPADHPSGAELFWDPVSGAFQQHLQQVLHRLPSLEQRGQTLFMTACWVGENHWLSSALLYQKVTVIEQQQLFMSEHEIQALLPEADASEVWLQTAGWPVLVANWDNIAAQRFRHSWLDFMQTRILPQLPFHEQRLLVALAFCPVLKQSAIHAEPLNIETMAPLVQLNSLAELRLGVPYLRAVLKEIASKEVRLFQGAMRIVSKHYQQSGQRLEAIQTAIESNNLDLALQWFKHSGGGMYGYYHGFQELDKVLALFPELMLSQELHLAWANMLSLLKSQQFLQAQHFLEKLPLDSPGHFESQEDRGIVALMKSKQRAYFSPQTSAQQLLQHRQLEKELAGHHGALMSYYASASVTHSNNGEWFQASVYQDKELALAQKHDIPYLIFYCHFNKARFDLRMGYPERALSNIEQADIALKRVSYYPTLTFERNFVDLVSGIHQLMSGNMQNAAKLWDKVATLRKHSEIWPDFLMQFHLFGLCTKLLDHSMDDAYRLHDELRYEYQLSFTDDSGNVFFSLLHILILQQQERWVDAQKYLDMLNATPERLSANVRELHHYLELRNQVGLICIHQQKRAVAPLDNSIQTTPLMEIASEIQLIKLLWFKREYSKMQSPLADLLVRCYRLEFWFVLLLESQWLNAAVQWLWKKEKQRHLNTQLEEATRAWQQRHQALSIQTEIEELSAKQLQVIQRLAEGLSNKQIAQYCGISESTVKFHLKNLFKQYQIKNRQALLALAKSKKWIK